MYKNTWVKNVHSLWFVGARLSPNPLFSYTGNTPKNPSTTNDRAKAQLLTNFVDTFTPALYTYFTRVFNLLGGHLYTLSTVPTIKKTKEK